MTFTDISLLGTMATPKEKLIIPVVEEATISNNKITVVDVGMVCAISILGKPQADELVLWGFQKINSKEK